MIARPRERQTETAVLGVLSVEPMTGYAVRAAISDVLGHFWNESYGQIYPTLTALESEGHVTRWDAARTGASTYAITGSGRARLRELLKRPIRPSMPRNGLLLRLFFGRQLGMEACRALLMEARAEASRQLESYAAIREEIAGESGYAGDKAYWLLTVSAGEHTARATLAWADESIAALDEPDIAEPLSQRHPSGRERRRVSE